MTAFYLNIQLTVPFSTGWGERDLADSVIAMHGIPLFHGMGMLGISYAVSFAFFISYLFLLLLNIAHMRLYHGGV